MTTRTRLRRWLGCDPLLADMRPRPQVAWLCLIIGCAVAALPGAASAEPPASAGEGSVVESNNSETYQASESQLELLDTSVRKLEAHEDFSALLYAKAALRAGVFDVGYLNLGRVSFVMGYCDDAARAFDMAESAPALAFYPREQVLAALAEFRADLQQHCTVTLTPRCDVQLEEAWPAEIRVESAEPVACGTPVRLRPARYRVEASAGPASVERWVDLRAEADAEPKFILANDTFEPVVPFASTDRGPR